MTVTDTPSRKYYKALRLRSKTGRSTGIGIIEYSVGKTLQLASLYYDCQLTNREAFEEIVKYVESTRDGQPAKVRITSIRNFKTDGEVRYVAVRGGRHMLEPELLAKAALKRKGSVREQMEV